jgi:two-component system NtrC family sensor kinase
VTEAVLVVDDSLTVRMDLAEAFGAAGFRTMLSATAAETRSILARESVSVVVLDVLLPDADGLELLQEIRASALAKAPVILLLSTEADVAHRIRGLATGADDYIGKPYDAGYVVARTRELLRGRAEKAPSDRTTILVIDDSATFRGTLRSGLEAAGYDVLTASSGEEGLRVAATGRPQAILVDGVMTGMDGGTVIRRLRLDAALRATPCILLTASEDGDAELRALDSGADAFVRKEEDLEVVLARLAAVLRRVSTNREEAQSLLDPKRILAVDDSPTYLHELAAILQGEGYDVVLARSGEEALDMLAAQHVDCVLLDLIMPGLDGIETCRRVKASPVARDIPLILLTAVEDRTAMIAGLSTGADDFISKSSEFEVLKARVRAQLRRKQLEDEHRKVREQLLRSQIEASEARAQRELAETRAALVEEMKRANHELGQAYRELQATQAQLVQSAKMASLGELVAGVAHEINNPLAFAVSHLSTARRSLEKLGRRIQTESSQADLLHWERAEDRLREMSLGLERIRELVVKLRTFSRMDGGERGLISMRECVDSLLTILGHRLRGGIEVETRLGEPDQIECFPSLINQALLNLVSNAIDAIDGHGRLAISTGVDGDSYSITVTDTGPGIPEELRERVLEPFFTTKPVGAGTGLGLSITYSIVKKHQGTLELRDAEGGGTAAIIKIPLIPIAPASP